MTDAQEKSLIEALKKVDAHGDIAPAHVQDPMTMVLRQRAIQADLMRWDNGRGHYVLTGTGRSRISARGAAFMAPSYASKHETTEVTARRTGKPIDEQLQLNGSVIALLLRDAEAIPFSHVTEVCDESCNQ